jgi:hypothetical protein
VNEDYTHGDKSDGDFVSGIVLEYLGHFRYTEK